MPIHRRHQVLRILPGLLVCAFLPGPLAAQGATLSSIDRAAPPVATTPPEGGVLALRWEDAPPPSLEPRVLRRERRQPLASRHEWQLYTSGILLLTAADRSTLRWFDRDRFEREAAEGRLSQHASDLASGWPLLVELALPALVDGRYGRQSAMLAVGATLNALVVVQPLKLLFGKERPDQAHGDTVFHGPSTGYTSFPSGHTAIAFAIGTVYAERYPRWRIPIYLLATGIGLARVEAGRHHLSDVFAGAGIGVLAGRASLRGGGRLLSWRF